MRRTGEVSTSGADAQKRSCPLRTTVRRAGPYRMSAVHLGDADVHRSPVLLVHGMVVAGRGMLRLAEALWDRGFAAHLPDLPGFGRSDKPAHALDVEGLASSLGLWMDSVGLERPAVLGNSFGTQVAAALAARTPNSASRVVLLSPTIDARLRGRWARLLPTGRVGGPVSGGVVGRWQRGLRDRLVPVARRGERPSLSSLLAREYLAAGPARALSTYRHALRDELADRMARIDVPMLVVRAANDGLVSPAWAARLASSAPRGDLAEVAGAGHDVQFDSPDAVADLLGPFLAGR